MSDLIEAGSAPLQVILERVDPSRNVARYYVLSIEPTLFARDTLVRRWGRIGSAPRERMQWFDDDTGARSRSGWPASAGDVMRSDPELSVRLLGTLPESYLAASVSSVTEVRPGLSIRPISLRPDID